jgi:hypothetical protein
VLADEVSRPVRLIRSQLDTTQRQSANFGSDVETDG